jgi:hypothetical protein
MGLPLRNDSDPNVSADSAAKEAEFRSPRDATFVARSAPKVLLRFAFALALAALTGELVMRHYYYGPAVFDPEFGFVPEGTAVCRREGDGVGHWGARGIRDSPSRPTAAQSILVLGDSFTEARQVGDDEVFTSVLERGLSQDGLRYAVLNAGVDGLTLPYYIESAEPYIRAFSPLWTIVAVSADDVTSSAWLSIATRFIRREDGSLGIKANPPVGRGGPIRRFIRYARAHSALLQNYVLQHEGYAREMKRFHPFVQTAIKGAPEENPQDYPIREELSMLEGRFHRRVTILFLAKLRPATPDAPSPTERAVLEICAEEGWSCRSTRESFDGFVARGAAPAGFPNSRFNEGHLNALGHAAVAGILRDEIRKLAQHGLL